MRASRRIIGFLSMAFAAALVAACGTSPSAPTAPTAMPPTPTPLSLPKSAPATAVPATSAPAAEVAPVGTELTGASLYQMSCAACHGADRAGQTFDMDGQKISVPALDWADLSQTYATDPSRGDVATQLGLAITKGQSETGDQLDEMMPRWSALSKAQVDSLIEYIQSASTSAGAAPTLTAAATGLQGQELYQASCAACHGEDGAGKTFESDGNKISTPSLHWGDLSQMYAANPSRGDVAQQLALAITKGEDEAGDQMNPMMPHWSFLSQAQVDSLVQFLQSTFK